MNEISDQSMMIVYWPTEITDLRLF